MGHETSSKPRTGNDAKWGKRAAGGYGARIRDALNILGTKSKKKKNVAMQPKTA